MTFFNEEILKSLVRKREVKDKEGNIKGIVFIPNKKR